MMSKNKVGLCIVGCGDFAHTHANAAAQRPEAVELFFASRSAAKACDYARQYGGAGAFGNYEAAARDPRVDALLFCTPHALHRPHFDLAVAHGKHVMMDKPIATSLEDARAMQRRAREAGIHFAVAENYRYMPTLRAATELIQQGVIGSLRALHLQATKYQRSTGWRLSRQMMGGGALMDAGIHKIAALRMLAGDPQQVSAVSPPKLFPEMEGEEAVSLWARFPGGAIATLTYSWAALGEPGTQHVLILGDQGHIEFDLYGDSLQTWTEARQETLTFSSDFNGISATLAGFLDLIVHDTPVLISPEEAIGDLRFVLTAYASMELDGQPVPHQND
jgi:predicted dehydrogenase